MAWPDLAAEARRLRKEAMECEGFANFYQRRATELRQQAGDFERTASDKLYVACRNAVSIAPASDDVGNSKLTRDA